MWNGDIIVGEDCFYYSPTDTYPDHWVVSAVPEGKTYDAKAGFYTLELKHGGRAWIEVDYATQINLEEEKSGTLGHYPKHGAALYWIYLHKGKKYQILFDASGDDIDLWVYKWYDCKGTDWYDACTWEDAIESYDPDSDWQEFSPPSSDTYIFVVRCPAKYDITYHLKVREKPNEPPEVSKVWANIMCEWGRDEIIVYAEASDPDGEVTQVEFEYSTDHSTWHNIGTDYSPDWMVWWDTSSIKEDSSVWIRARAKDDKGAYSPWKEAGPYKIDNKPPSTTHSISPSSPNGDNGWYTSCVDIKFSASDSGSGVDCTFFKIDDGNWMKGNKIEDFCDEGKHTIEYYSRDKACDYHGVPGNEEEPKSFTLKINRNKPTASISINNGAEYTNSRSVTLYLDYDDSCSGVWKVRYKNEGGSWTSWENPSSMKSWTLPSGDGRKRVCYQVKDYAGLLSDDVCDDILLDTKPPSASCTLSPALPDGENGWYVSPVKVTLSASDPTPGSGVKKIHYRIDGGSWQESPPLVTFTISSDGKHKVEYYAEDNAGNRGETKSCEFKIDRTKPPAPSPDDGVEGWSNDNTPTFTWDEPSDTSGIAGYYWKVDSGSDHWTTSTSVTLPAQTDGEHTFYVRAKDNAGNIGEYGSHKFKIDTTPPSSEVKELPKVQTSTTFTVSWGGFDALSGIKWYNVQYKKDDGPWTNWLTHTTLTSKQFTGERGHTYYFRCRAQDNAGNWEDYGGADTYTYISCPPNKPSNPSPSDGATNVPIDTDLSWSCSDPDGDALKYDIYFGDTNPPPLVKSDYTSTTYDPGILEYNTKYYWKIVAKDGYAETEGDVWSFTTASPPDTIPPETEIIEGPSGTINYNDVKFVWRGKDDNTPTSELVYSYKLEGYDSGWSPWTSSTSKEYKNLPNGDYTFKVKAKDKAGNVDPTPAERTFTVLVEFGVDLPCENPNKYVAPGETATYKIKVKNTGNRQDTISLSHSIPPSGWTASLSKTSVVLKAGESTEVTLNVTPPQSAKDGDYALIDVIGKSESSGKVDTITTNTTVRKKNQPPIASFTYSPQHPKVNENITFDASSSYDSDGKIVKYEWDFGDGSIASGKIVTHTYSQPGTYTVTLTVTDDDGLTNTRSKQITVSSIHPSIKIYTDKSSYKPGDIQRLGLNVKNEDGAYSARIKIWIETPTGLTKVLMDKSLILPASLDYTNPTFKVFKVPNIKSGEYTWHAQIINTTTEVIVSESCATWTLTATTSLSSEEFDLQLPELEFKEN